MAQKISQLAESQPGNVGRQQLLVLGPGGDAIQHRVTNGELIPKHAGVYAVGHREPGPIPRRAAATTNCSRPSTMPGPAATSVLPRSRSSSTAARASAALSTLTPADRLKTRTRLQAVRQEI
jgi:hypothetical protein